MSLSFVRARIGRVLAVGALSALLAGCAALFPSAPPVTFDLTAPRSFTRHAGAIRGILVVSPPAAIEALGSNRMLVRSAGGQVAYVPDAQWSDQLPALLQARMVQAFENAGRLRSVGRSGDRLTPDYQLSTDLRAFEIQAGAGSNEAVVEIAAKVVGDRSGKILGAQVFTARVPLTGAVAGPTAAVALDAALNKVLTDIVLWATARF